MNFLAHPWQPLHGPQAFAASTVTNVVQNRVAIPVVNLFATFRVVLTAFTAGNIVIKLRFGFLNADADAATIGIDFAALAAANASDLRSVAFDVAGAAPSAVGSAPAILPPWLTVLATTVGFTGTVALHYTAIELV